METKMNEIINANNGRLGTIKGLGLPLKLPRFSMKTMLGIPEPAYRASEGCHKDLAEIECQKARARAEVQRFQLNR